MEDGHTRLRKSFTRLVNEIYAQARTFHARMIVLAAAVIIGGAVAYWYICEEVSK